jgi:hypothetical protein
VVLVCQTIALRLALGRSIAHRDSRAESESLLSASLARSAGGLGPNCPGQPRAAPKCPASDSESLAHWHFAAVPRHWQPENRQQYHTGNWRLNWSNQK